MHECEWPNRSAPSYFVAGLTKKFRSACHITGNKSSKVLLKLKIKLSYEFKKSLFQLNASPDEKICHKIFKGLLLVSQKSQEYQSITQASGNLHKEGSWTWFDCPQQGIDDSSITI